MKLWELISAFRSEQPHLDSVFAPRSNYPLSEAYADFDSIVEKQERAVLDSVVPAQIIREVAAGSCQVFSLSSDGVLRGFSASSTDMALTALQVVDRYGGSIIEEVNEKGSARVTG